MLPICIFWRKTVPQCSHNCHVTIYMTLLLNDYFLKWLNLQHFCFYFSNQTFKTNKQKNLVRDLITFDLRNMEKPGWIYTSLVPTKHGNVFKALHAWCKKGQCCLRVWLVSKPLESTLSEITRILFIKAASFIQHNFAQHYLWRREREVKMERMEWKSHKYVSCLEARSCFYSKAYWNTLAKLGSINSEVEESSTYIW